MHSNKILSKVMGGNPEPGYQQITALAKRHKKPFMLGEAGPFAGPVQSWKDWYEPFFGFVNSHGAKAFTFNNQPVLPECKEFGDERMEVMSKDIQHRWSAEMLKPRYLKPDANLFDVLGYKNK